MKAYCRRCERVTEHKDRPIVECHTCGKHNGTDRLGFCRKCEDMVSWDSMIDLTCPYCKGEEVADEDDSDVDWRTLSKHPHVDSEKALDKTDTDYDAEEDTNWLNIRNTRGPTNIEWEEE